MRGTEAPQGVRMAMFLNLLHRGESAEFNQEEAAELLGVDVRTFRRWTRRYEERARPGLRTAGLARRGQAGPGGPGGGGGAALPRALPGLYGQALRRASGEGPWLRLGL